MKKFSVKGKQESVVLEDANGVESVYTIREYSADSRDRYIDAQMKKAEYTAKGELVKVLDHKGVQTRLLAECLYDAKEERVPESVISSWPDSLVRGLYEIATKVCNLVTDEDEETDPKKD